MPKVVDYWSDKLWGCLGQVIKLYSLSTSQRILGFSKISLYTFNTQFVGGCANFLNCPFYRFNFGGVEPYARYPQRQLVLQVFNYLGEVE